ncbi:hypothetical protein VNO77_49217 [Canavalia gladiata]|uniref:Uncharacterized protein n=1 Tax=Canavalia gladiata TaxID=3824 RepID=A0AAN9PFV2_CANGL
MYGDVHASMQFEYNQPSGQTGKPTNIAVGEMPLSGNLIVTTRFGMGRTNSDGSARTHAGLDIVNTNGDHKLYAIADGTVIANDWLNGGGKVEELRQAIESGRSIALISNLELEDLPPTASDYQLATSCCANPNDLAAVISFETAGSFSTNARNPKGSATGLIQFMQYTDGTGNKNTPRSQWDYWGMTRDQFGALSFSEQMKYVEKYFKDRGLRESKPTSLGQLYSLVMGVPSGGYTIARYPDVFRDNPAWDVNGDGVITGAEAVSGSQFKSHIRLDNQYYQAVQKLQDNPLSLNMKETDQKYIGIEKKLNALADTIKASNPAKSKDAAWNNSMSAVNSVYQICNKINAINSPMGGADALTAGSGYEFLIHPTTTLLSAKHDDIVEIVQGKIFFLAYNLLRLADGYDFFVQKDNEELETKHPMIAIYETLISPIDQNSTILFNEPHIETECTDVVIQMRPNEKLVSITGEGMSLGSIKLLETFVSLSYLYSDMAVEYSC